MTDGIEHGVTEWPILTTDTDSPVEPPRSDEAACRAGGSIARHRRIGERMARSVGRNQRGIFAVERDDLIATAPITARHAVTCGIPSVTITVGRESNAML